MSHTPCLFFVLHIKIDLQAEPRAFLFTRTEGPGYDTEQPAHLPIR